MAAYSSVTYFTADYLGHVALQAVERSRQPNAGFDALVAVVFSVLAAEATVNELLHLVADDTHEPQSPVQALKSIGSVVGLDERGASLRTKIQTIATVLTGQAFDEGRQPFQDFSLLVDARNFLVHHRPEYASKESETDDWQVSRLIRRLETRGFKRRADVDTPSAMDILQQKAVAEWAYLTSSTMMKAVLAAFPKAYGPVRLQLSFGWANEKHAV